MQKEHSNSQIFLCNQKNPVKCSACLVSKIMQLNVQLLSQKCGNFWRTTNYNFVKFETKTF